MPRQSIAEISRLAIIAKYRQPKNQRLQAVDIALGAFGAGVRPRFPYLLIGLYLGTVELARLQNIETLFVMTEPRLARHFRKLGVRIQTVGAPVEHHGMRIPSMMKISTVRAELKAIFRSLYGSIAKTIVAGLNRAH